LVFVDRLLATLVHLRHATTHDVLACWFGVDRSTITRAIAEMRPSLAERGCTVSQGVRLRTLPEVIDHLGADGKTGIIDGTEIRVRRPAAGRKAAPGCPVFASASPVGRTAFQKDSCGVAACCPISGPRTRHRGRPM
jgi:hypothetical protein